MASLARGSTMRRSIAIFVLTIAGGLAVGVILVEGAEVKQNTSIQPTPVAERPTFTQEGFATWYGKARRGHRTASGESYDWRAMTAAHQSLPFGTIVRVTNLANGQVVKVRINDRRPNTHSSGRRIIDLSKGEASALGITKGGVTKVRIEELTSEQLGARM
jgi:rare lipoprotein A